MKKSVVLLYCCFLILDSNEARAGLKGTPGLLDTEYGKSTKKYIYDKTPNGKAKRVLKKMGWDEGGCYSQKCHEKKKQQYRKKEFLEDLMRNPSKASEMETF